MSTSASQVECSPHRLHIRWRTGTSTELTSLWLRDNCPQNRDPVSGQRLVDILDLPAEPLLQSASLEGDTVAVQWTDGHQASFDLGWLARTRRRVWEERPELAPRPWAGGDAAGFAWAPLPQILTDPAARRTWLTCLLQDGLAFLNAVPCTPAGILDAMRPLGRVLATNYGEVFDVRSVPQPENLAYSDLGLGLHTDNPYRDPVPGFQALHVLVASPEGGDSLFADGFALAQRLRAMDAGAFETLTRTPVPFLYRSPGTELYAQRPLIDLSCDGQVRAVHYNNRSIAPLHLPPSRMEAFYDAYRKFAALLRDPSLQLRLRLGEGDLVVFDNQRILHGRTAFSSARHPRHLRGCYLARDSVLAAAAGLRGQDGSAA